MQHGEENMNDQINEIVLSVKAAMLLCGNSVECREELMSRINSLQDEQVSEFIDMFQRPRKSILPQITMAVGEIIMASMLLYIGVAILTPALVGFTGPGVFLNYFMSTQVALINSVPYFPFVLLTDFIIAIVLLSAAFYALRESAESIRKTGLQYR